MPAVLAVVICAPAEARPLTQLSGPAGCIVEVVVPGCATAVVGSPEGIVVAGNHAYVSSVPDDRIRIYDRDPSTGALTPRPAGPAGCIAEDGPGTTCADAKALDGPTRMALSPDGTRLYVVAANSASVVALIRDPSTGNLSQAGDNASCINATGVGPCAVGPPIGSPSSLAVSPNGADLYVVGGGAAGGFVTLLDVTGGLLSQHDVNAGGCAENTVVTTGCINARAMNGAGSVRLSSDGNHVYVTSAASNAVTGFTRGVDGALTAIAGTGGCLQKTAGGEGCLETDLLGTEIFPIAFTSATRGYVGGISGSHITMVDRNPTTGALSAPGPCASNATTGPLAACADSPSLFGVLDLEPTPDGELLAGARFGRGMLAFTIAADGGPVPVPPPGGCLATGGFGQTSPCTIPRGFGRNDPESLDFGPGDVAVSADGNFAYGVSPFSAEDQAGIVVASRPAPVVEPPPPDDTTPPPDDTTPPPQDPIPPPVVDKVPPTSSVEEITCSRKHRCKIEVSASDAGGGSVAGLAARITGKVKTRDGDTQQVTKTPEAKASGGGFEIKLKLKPGRYTVETTATDTNGNVQSPPASQRFRVKR